MVFLNFFSAVLIDNGITAAEVERENGSSNTFLQSFMKGGGRYSAD